MDDWRGKHLIATPKQAPVELPRCRTEVLDNRRNDVRRLFNEGFNMPEISERLGLTQGVVRHDLTVLGLTCAGRRRKQMKENAA